MASGGHSHIVEVQDYTHYHILGHTVDDAAGEAFDKVARTLGLPYPGGPSVANAAKTGDPKAYRLPVPHVEGKYNVSFSGLKTAVLNEVNQAQMKGTDINVPDLAASFQERIAGILAEKLLLAAADTGDIAHDLGAERKRRNEKYEKEAVFFHGTHRLFLGVEQVDERYADLGGDRQETLGVDEIGRAHV